MEGEVGKRRDTMKQAGALPRPRPLSHTPGACEGRPLDACERAARELPPSHTPPPNPAGTLTRSSTTLDGRSSRPRPNATSAPTVGSTTWWSGFWKTKAAGAEQRATPPETGVRPPSARSRVDLPHPLGPSRMCRVPGGTRRVAPARACQSGGQKVEGQRRPGRCGPGAAGVAPRLPPPFPPPPPPPSPTPTDSTMTHLFVSIPHNRVDGLDGTRRRQHAAGGGRGRRRREQAGTARGTTGV